MPPCNPGCGEGRNPGCRIDTTKRIAGEVAAMNLAKSPLRSDGSADARRVRIARERLHDGDEPDSASVRPAILASWRRSREAGVDPGWATAPIVRSTDRAADRVEPAALRSAAAPVLRLLDAALGDHSFLLMLTDDGCRPLDLFGSSRVLREGERINVVAGSEWTESRVGTDAVALSRVLGEPVQVHWYEHFATVGDPWTGNASPIRDLSTGDVTGTLSIYGHGGIAHPQALELVTGAASLIEQRLAKHEHRRRLRLVDRYAEHLGRHAGDAAVCVTREGAVVAISPAASELLDVLGDRSIGRPFRALPGIQLRGGEPFSATSVAGEIEIERGADRLRAEIHPLGDDGEISGFLVRIGPRSRADVRRRPTHAAWRTSYGFADVVGDGAPIREAIASARLAAERDATVLLVGESGTGKELFAHAIHAASPRANGPFVPLNCGGMSDELLSAELFGYEDGAFTGAARGGRAGKLELADGGTLFLDELEGMSPRMQTHLLRFLDERIVLRIGGSRPLPIDVRIVGATNVDLGKLVERRRFRADLFYRLSVLPISLPPLRERLSDLRALAEHLIASEKLDKALTPLALARLERHAWPGNVRELRNVLVQGALRAPGPALRAEDLPLLPASDGAPPPRSPPGLRRLAEAERKALLEALTRHRGCVGDAAAELGIHRVTLYRKLKRHGVRAERGFR
jgi:sigma-54 dependent transcriptional regulator, acetoin dehydrogenase operon transcriptional activator AcoR